MEYKNQRASEASSSAITGTKKEKEKKLQEEFAIEWQQKVDAAQKAADASTRREILGLW